MLARSSRGLTPAALLALILVATSASPAASRTRADAVRAEVVSWAVKQAGARELGTTNCSPRIDRWMRGMGLRARPCRPWCGSFVHAAFLQAGVRLSSRLIDPQRSYADAVRGRRGLQAIPVRSVKPGDLLFFAFRPNMVASHFAIVRSRPRGGRIATIEGNVAHGVRLKRRGMQYPVLAVRVRV